MYNEGSTPHERTAKDNEAPTACVVGALVLLMAALVVLFNDSVSYNLLDQASTWVVLGIWGTCSMLLGFIAFWAAYTKRDPHSTYKDVWRIGLVGALVFAIAVFSSLLFGTF